MKSYPSNSRPFHRNALYVGAILILLAAWLALRVLSGRAATPAQAVNDVWDNTRRAGAYQFDAQITQNTIPLATVANAGRTSKRNDLQLTGRTDLTAHTLAMTLYAQGGTLLDRASGVELKLENGRSYARMPGEAWQAIADLTGLTGPDGDFLSYLVGATNVAEAGSETRNGITFTRYTYDIDGPAFARYMRDQLAQQLRGQGALAANVNVTPPPLLTGMTGSGELWVDADGLPLRNRVTLSYPPEDGHWAQTEMTVTFSDFGNRLPLLGNRLGNWAERLTLPVQSLSAAALWSSVQDSITLLLLIAPGGVLALLVARNSRSRLLYTGVALSVIASMVISPLLQVAFAEEAQATLQALQAREAALREESAASRGVRTAIADAQNATAAAGGPAILAQIRADNGSDSDGDGATDVQEQLLGSDIWSAADAPAADALSASSTLDSDADGLTDLEEALLGTDSANADTDGDTISDFDEISGFSHAGETWYTNPLQTDTNNDQLSDALEWNRPGTLHATWDSDGDGVPDLFDEDNDDDGVPDRYDISPFSAPGSLFSAANPFNLTLDGLTAGEVAFVEMQLRPTNPAHLTYALTALDWPDDPAGNLKDTDKSVEDIRLLPALEIIVPDAPYNLPVTTPQVEVTITGVLTPGGGLEPPLLALDPISGTLTLTQNGDDVAIDSTLSAAGFLLLRDGTCISPGARVADPVTLATTGGGQVVALGDFIDQQLAVRATRPTIVQVVNQPNNGLVQGCGQLPIKAFDGAMMIDSDYLAAYQISVRDVGAGSTAKAIYAPLRMVVDEDGGGRVAFAAQVPYVAAGEWQAAHQVRLVWSVQFRNDEVCVSTRVTQSNNLECAQYLDNVPQIIHSYGDDWRLTGLNVREDVGVTLATVYEDPAVDPDVQDDLQLTELVAGLERSFLAGRTDAAGHLDIDIAEIARRFDHPANAGVTLQERWAISDTLRVVTDTFDTIDEMVRDSGQTAATILDGAFTAAWSPATPISPTILSAYTWQLRSLNLDIDSGTSNITFDAAGRSARFDFSNEPLATRNAVQWRPYRYDGSRWSPYAIEDYWNALGVLLSDAFLDEPDLDIRDGKAIAVQLFYLVVNNGLSRTVQLGDQILKTNDDIPDREIFFGKTVAGGVASGASFITKNLLQARLLEGEGKTFYKYLKTAVRVAGGETIREQFANAKKLFARFEAKASLKNTLIVGGMFVAAAVVLTGLMLWITAIAVGQPVFLGTVSVILLIVAAYGVYSAIQDTITLLSTLKTFSDVAAYGKVLVATKAAGVANAVGAILTVLLIWGYFIYEVTAGSVAAGKVDIDMLAAFAVAVSLVAVLFLVIASIPVVGQILAAILGLIDALFAALCALEDAVREGEGLMVPVEERTIPRTAGGSCFGISNLIIEFLVQVIYQKDTVFDFEAAELRPTERWPQLTDFNMDLGAPVDGLVAGNTVRFRASLSGSLGPSFPKNAGVARAYEVNNLLTTRYIAELSPTANAALSQTLDTAGQSIGWIAYRESSIKAKLYTITFFGGGQLINYVDRYVLTPTPRLLQTAPMTLTAGINRQFPVYLNLALKLPLYECIMGFCYYGEEFNYSGSANQVDTVMLDVLPATLDAFFARNWAVFPSYRDFDGDGLLRASAGGLDPDDSTWDADGDGLTDAFELAQAQPDGARRGVTFAPTQADTDNDGLCDRDELRLGTRPDLADTDGDGLLDSEEVWHQSCGNSFWFGGWAFTYDTAANQTVRVQSNPLAFDSDGDGMSDRAERDLHLADPAAFPFHPLVPNESPVGVALATNDVDNVLAPGGSMVVTATVFNNLARPYYADGTLTRNFPAALGGNHSVEPFRLMQGQTQPFTRNVSASGGSQTVEIVNLLSADLLASASATPPSAPSFVLTETLPVTIDADKPTSTLVGLPYVQADGFRILGGTASDLTSYITGVEVQVVGVTAWGAANGSSTWAYSWQVPATEGPLTVQTRATDAVGNVESPVNSQQVIVDGTPPGVTTAQTGNPLLGARRNASFNWTLALNGTVADPLIGSDPGSGVQAAEVLVTPFDSGWQVATLDGSGNWQINYPLARYDANNQPLVQATGAYSVSIRAIDNVDNTTAPGDYVVVPVRVDTTPPDTTLESLTTRTVAGGQAIVTETLAITRTLVLTGTVTDPGAFASGVAAVEVAFTPAEALDALGAPAALYFLNEPVGLTPYSDSSGNGHDATCATNRCPVNDAAGIYGGALDFDGTNDLISATLNLAESDLTISAWFNTTAASGGLVAGVDGPQGSGGSDRALYLVGGNVCAFVDGAVNVEICSSGTPYNDGNWHQAALVLEDGVGLALYVDGAQAAFSPVVSSSDFAAQSSLALGFARTAGGVPSYLNGLLDEVEVYNAPLAADLIAALHQRWQPATVLTPGATTSGWQLAVPADLEGLYQLDVRAADSVGNRNDTQRGAWNKWRGWIDTAEPRIAFTQSYLGSGPTAQTRFDITLSDFALTTDGYSGPCDLTNAQYEYGAAGLWEAAGQPNRLVQITLNCTRPGHIVSSDPDLGWAFSVTACDMAGNCGFATAEREVVYWSSFANNLSSISRQSLNGYPDQQALVSGRPRITGLDLDTQRGHLYWLENDGPSGDKIMRSDLDGNDISELPVAVNIPAGPIIPTTGDLIVNAQAGKLYWSESDRVMRANLDGSALETVFTLVATPGEPDRIGRLAVDPVSGNVYFGAASSSITYGLGAQIWRMAADGSGATVLVDTDALSNVILTDIALAADGGTLYWIAREYLSGTPSLGIGLWQVSTAGGTPSDTGFAAEEGTSFGALGISAAETYAYISRGNAIRRVDLGNGDTDNLLFDEAAGARQIRAVAFGRIPGLRNQNTDLALEKGTTGAAVAANGGTLTYELTARNNGPVGATDVVIVDTLPAGTTFNAGGSSAGCAATPGNTVTCDVGVLFSGASKSVTIRINVSGAPRGLSNNATISSPADDPVPANDSVTFSDAAVVPAATAVPGSARHVYWFRRNELLRHTIGTPESVKTLLARPASLQGADQMVVDPLTQRVYWSVFGSILRAEANGTAVTTVFNGNVNQLAIDAVNGHLYFTDGDQLAPTTAIKRINLNGSGLTTIIAGTPQLDIDALAVNTLRGQLVWADVAGNLNKANLDGSNVRALASGLLVARQIALDEGGDMVYFISDQGIERVPMNGDARELIVAGALTGPAIDEQADKLYYVGAGPSLLRANLDGSGVETVVTAFGARFPTTQLRIVFTNAPVPPAPTPTSTPTSAAPTATPSPSPTPTASPTPLPSPTPGGPAGAERLFWSNNAGDINSAPVAGCNDGSCITPVVTPSAGTAAGDLDIDWLNGHIYWINPLDDAIQRAELDGSNPQTLISGLGDPQGIALDLAGERIYWTDYTAGTISRAAFDGSAVEIVIAGLNSPLWIDIDDVNRHAFFVESEQNRFSLNTTRIRRISLDGPSNLLDVLVGTANPDAPEVNQQTTFYALVMGLAVDDEFGRIYWTENDNTGPARVRVMTVDGTGLQTLEDVSAITGLAYDGNSYKLYRGAGDSVNFSAPDVNPPYTIDRLARDGVISGIPTDPVLSGPPLDGTGGTDAGPVHLALAFPTPTPEPCPTDGYEPDNSFGTATALTIGSASLNHTFGDGSDVDWFALTLAAGSVYDLRAYATGSEADTVMQLYAADGTTLLASNDDESGSSVDSLLRYDALADGTHYLRVTNKTTTFAVRCNSAYNVEAQVGSAPPAPPIVNPNPGELKAPDVDSAIATPQDGAVIGALGSVLITGTAYSNLAAVDTVTVTVNGATTAVVTTFSGDTWQTNAWSPAAEGSYVLASMAADSAGNVQTMTHPITVSVDLAPPNIGLNLPVRSAAVTVVYTQTHLTAGGQIILSGPANDSNGIALVELRFGDGPYIPATHAAGTWSYAWTPGVDLDGGSTQLTLRATDKAGRTATAQYTLVVDAQSPSIGVITPTLNTTPPIVLSIDDVIAQALPTLGIEWQTPTDAAGVQAVYAGYTTSPTPTIGALTAVAPGGPHSQSVPEAQSVFAHVMAVDNNGNQASASVGPFHVDGPATPDLVGDVLHDGWLNTGGSQLAADREVNRGPFAGSPFGVIQRFYTSWDDETLALAWLGANWNSDGDLFIYLDTAGGGASSLFDPFATPGDIGLPTGFTPNVLIWVQDDGTAERYTFSGGNWTLQGALTATQFRHDTATLPLVTNVQLPLALLGLTNASSLGVLAVASEEGALKLWAASPDQSPLNSARSINPAAAGRNLGSYALTLFDSWPALALGIVPNGGRFADSDLQLSITPNVAGVVVGYLESDLLDLLQPGSPLDSDEDGTLDVALPGSIAGDTVGNGQTLTYNVQFTNNGSMTVTGVTLDLTASSALNLSTPSVALGDIGPGESGTASFTGTVNGAAADSVEVQAALSDNEHGTYDWLWVQHPVDTEAPTALTILEPLTVTNGLTTTVFGTLSDASAVPNLTVRVTPQPAGTPFNIACTDPTPRDGQWQCVVDLGTLAGFTSVQLRVRATDEFGNTSAFTAPTSLAIDQNAPLVQFDAGTAAALADGYLTAAETTLSGQVVDDVTASELQVCVVAQPGLLNCQPRIATLPAGQPTGGWAYALGDVTPQDGVTLTLRLTGYDAAGNVSDPVTETVRLDGVAPQTTLVQITDTVKLEDYDARASGPVLQGTASDGGELVAIVVRIDQPDGNVLYQPADITRSSGWTFTPVLNQEGVHALTVELTDAAGNTRAVGPLPLQVDGAETAVSLRGLLALAAPGVPTLLGAFVALAAASIGGLVARRLARRLARRRHSAQRALRRS